MKLLIAVKSEIIANALVSALSMYDVHTCDTGLNALARQHKKPESLTLLSLRYLADCPMVIHTLR